MLRLLNEQWHLVEFKLPHCGKSTELKNQYSFDYKPPAWSKPSLQHRHPQQQVNLLLTCIKLRWKCQVESFFYSHKMLVSVVILENNLQQVNGLTDEVSWCSKDLITQLHLFALVYSLVPGLALYGCISLNFPFARYKYLSDLLGLFRPDSMQKKWKSWKSHSSCWKCH